MSICLLQTVKRGWWLCLISTNSSYKQNRRRLGICSHGDRMEPSAAARIGAVAGRHSPPPVRDR
jgi:hypothetical protein